MGPDYHAFVSYRLADREALDDIRKLLARDGIALWVADEHVRDPDVYDEEVLRRLHELPAALVVVGPQWPPGEWGVRELDELVARKREDSRFRLLQLALPGFAGTTGLPLDGAFWLRGLDDSETLEALARALLGEPPPAASDGRQARASTAPPESVDTLTDYPADVDELGRKVIAEVLARRIRAMRKEEAARHCKDRDRNRRRGGPFLLHLYGPWGVGKTSLLRFIRRELEEDPSPDRPVTQGEPSRCWIVIDFNAWRHQRIVPPWWWLMTSVFREARKELWRKRRWRRWARLVLWDLGWRLKGALPGLLLVAAGLVIGWLVWKVGAFGKGTNTVDSALKALEAVVKTLAAVLALLVTVWGAVRALSRWLVVGSPRAADAFIDHAKDPLQTLSRRFVSMIRVIDYPVAIFVDDLDRCQAKYVVELLEGIQTLFKEAPVAYVVAADRDWLCESYAQEYAGFSGAIGEPGRPLGYLFLEKTFQISAPVPALSVEAQQDFLHGLLRVAHADDPRELAAARERARAKYEGLRDESAIHETLAHSRDLPPVERQAEAEAAVLRLAHPEVEERTQHALQVFAPLLERNPRSMKRLVNAYGMTRATDILRGVDPGANGGASQGVALWTILSLRWPLLAEYLVENEKAVDGMRGGEEPPAEPEWLRALWRDDEVLAVLGGDAPGVDAELDAAAIRALVGKTAGKRPGAASTRTPSEPAPSAPRPA